MWPKETLDQVAKLRKTLETANWKMTDKEFWDLEIAHKKLMPQDYWPRKDMAGFYKRPEERFYHIFSSFQRVVCGAHGHYFELTKEDLACALEITKGQEWRCSDEYKYVKYVWLNPVGAPDLKVYLQKHTVKYANYKPGLYYIDFWKIELEID
jgi:hypothetical protein